MGAITLRARARGSACVRVAVGTSEVLGIARPKPCPGGCRPRRPTASGSPRCGPPVDPTMLGADRMTAVTGAVLVLPPRLRRRRATVPPGSPYSGATSRYRQCGRCSPARVPACELAAGATLADLGILIHTNSHVGTPASGRKDR